MRATTHTFGLSITIAMSQTYLRFRAEIAQQIAEQLQAKLSAAEKAAIAERPTADLVAYAYYTKAKEIDIWSNWEGCGKKREPKSGTARKGDAARSEFCFGLLRPRENAVDLASRDPTSTSS